MTANSPEHIPKGPNELGVLLGQNRDLTGQLHGGHMHTPSLEIGHDTHLQYYIQHDEPATMRAGGPTQARILRDVRVPHGRPYQGRAPRSVGNYHDTYEDVFIVRYGSSEVLHEQRVAGELGGWNEEKLTVASPEMVESVIKELGPLLNWARANKQRDEELLRPRVGRLGRLGMRLGLGRR